MKKKSKQPYSDFPSNSIGASRMIKAKGESNMKPFIAGFVIGGILCSLISIAVYATLVANSLN